MRTSTGSHRREQVTGYVYVGNLSEAHYEGVNMFLLVLYNLAQVFSLCGVSLMDMNHSRLVWTGVGSQPPCHPAQPRVT